MVIETKKISKCFGKISALVNVSMAMESGEIFAVAGPNGAGKSTLFDIISGTYPPSGGRIFFNGKDITKLNAHQTCHLGLARTFQIPATFKTLSVFDNIRVGATFGGQHRHSSEQKARQYIDFLDLSCFSSTLASNLDLYTTKLVMLAACLATGCKLLLLDEPLAGLSSFEIDDFLNVVRKINREDNISILIIEHILDSLLPISNRMLILNYGEVVCIGKPDVVCRDPKVIEVYLGEGERHTADDK